MGRAQVQILRDAGRIKAQRRQARWLTVVGIALLAGVLIVSNVMSGLAEQALSVWILLSYGGLIAGFVCFNAGLQGLTKWSEAPSRPRRDKVIDNHLRRLNDRYALFHYVTLDKRVYDHVVVHPGGVTVLIARDNFGQVSYTGGRWRRSANLAARIFNFAGPSVGNPHAEAASQAQGVQEYLHGQGLTVEVDSVIVFTNPRVVLTVDESAIPIRRAEDVGELLRERAATNQLTGGQRLQVTKLLTAAIPTPERVEGSKGPGTPTPPRPKGRTEPAGDVAAKPGRPRRIIGGKRS
jgi:nuclease-like protein